MPKTLYFTDSFKFSGIDITYYKTKRKLSIGGWYYGCVGIESKTMSLGEFLKELGITEKDIKKALSEKG